MRSLGLTAGATLPSASRARMPLALAIGEGAMPMTTAAEFRRPPASGGATRFGACSPHHGRRCRARAGPARRRRPPLQHQSCARPHRKRVPEPAEARVPHDPVPAGVAESGRSDNHRVGLRARAPLPAGLGRYAPRAYQPHAGVGPAQSISRRRDRVDRGGRARIRQGARHQSGRCARLRQAVHWLHRPARHRGNNPGESTWPPDRRSLPPPGRIRRP